MIVYEYIITFDQEVATVWQRKFTLTSILLLSTRYALVLLEILALLPASPVVS